MAEEDLVDRVGGVRFMTEVIAYFGAARGSRFLGWCMLLGAALRDGEKPQAAVKRLQSMGLSQSSAYRTIDELKEFQAWLRVKYPDPETLKEIFSEMGANLIPGN